MQTSFHVGEKARAVLIMPNIKTSFDGIITDINFKTDKAKVNGWWIPISDIRKNEVKKNEN